MFNRRIWTLAFVLSALAPCSPARAEDTKEVEVKGIKLQVPESWIKQEPKNNLRKVQYGIKPAEGEEEGEFYVSAFDNNAGGVPANLSRWMKQFEAEGREVTVIQGQSPFGKYVLADIKGTYNKSIGPRFQGKTKQMPNSRMLGAIIDVNGSYHFLKLTGGQKTIAKQAENFRKSFKADKDSEKPYEQ